MKNFLIICLIALLSLPTYAVSAQETYSDAPLSFENAHLYSSQDLYFMNLALIDAYPELLEMEILGYSYDHQPIYVMRLSNSLKQSNLYVTKMHGLIESGTHAREVANPVLTSMMLRDYIKDYIDDTYLPEINVQEMLEGSVLHFVINSNPDGYNIAKFGIASIKSESAYVKLLSLHDKNYSNYKANTRGVDLNRNYPDTYYDTGLNKWVNQWSIKTNAYTSDKPSGAYFFGYQPASELETIALMDYLLSYDFRYYLSYHSKGEVIYGKYTYMTSDVSNHIMTYTSLASTITGYPIPKFYESDASSGYMGNYIVNNTLKPAITIETIPYYITLPNVDSDDLKKAYQETYTLPYAFMSKALEDGYSDYRLYVNNRYIRDFSNLIYAKAIAEREGGVIVDHGNAKPNLYLNEMVSREEFIVALLRDIEIDDQDLENLELFNDTDNKTIHFARSKGIVNGYMNQFFPNRNISYLEAAITLYRYDQLFTDDATITTTRTSTVDEVPDETVPVWAYDAVQYCINKGYMTPHTAYNTFLKRADFEDLLAFSETLFNTNY